MTLLQIFRILTIASVLIALIAFSYIEGLHNLGAPFYFGILAIFFVSMSGWAFLKFKNIVSWAKSKAGTFYISLSITAFGVLLVLGTVNWLANDFNYKHDFTKNKLYSLSDQSRKLISGLENEVTIRVWSTNLQAMSSNVNLQKFLENYAQESGGKIIVEIKNPNENRALQEKDNITKDHVVVVQSADGREARVDNFQENKAEEQITNAIIQVVKGSKKTICFTSGHGEKEISDSSQLGLSELKARLEKSSYTTKTVNLVQTDQMYVDCELLMVVGPQTDALQKEITIIKEHLKNGGAVAAFLGSGTSKMWREMFSDYGLTLKKNILFDERVRPPGVVFTQNYTQEVDIVNGFDLPILLPEASSILLSTKTEEGVTRKAFVSSEERVSFAKAGTIKDYNVVNRKTSDARGPLAVAAWVKKTWPVEGGDDKAKESKAKETQIVLVGSHGLLWNNYLSNYGNSDFAVNIANVLMKDIDLVGIRPKELRQATLELNYARLRQVVGTIFIIALFFMGGALVAQRRRIVAI